MSAARPAFEPTAPLAPGITVLEASAGTGKTWQISTLVTRLVAEVGLPIDQVLVVTFTRAATDELVDRVRNRLREVLAAVRGATDDGLDPVAAHLWHRARGPAALPIAQRLHEALQRFDQATITTIHGFCQRMLQQNAFESLADADAELMTDDRVLRDAIRADLLARLRYDADAALRGFLDAAASQGGCGLAGDLDALLSEASRHPDAAVLPADSAGVLVGDASAAHLQVPADPAERAALAGRVRADVVRWARAELGRRARTQRVQTYDDLLRLLADALGPGVPEARRHRLAAAVRAQFSAALIDEFQDTDRVQWTIFRALFDASDRYLYLIGDPKQAIYGFRGANVHVYLDAVRHAGPGRVFTMTRNFRSDARLVDGLNHLLNHRGVFGDDAIRYVEVDAQHQADRLALPADWPPADPRRAGLQLRFFDGALKRGGEPGELLRAGELGPALAERVAEDVVELLDAGCTLDGRPVGPGDIAVLVRSHFQAQSLERALGARGVPSVRSGAASVFASDEARHLQSWLAAVAEAGRDGPARRAAATPIFGWTAADLAKLSADDAEAVGRWDAWLGSLQHAADQFARKGFMVAFRGALEAHEVMPRLLGWPDGERRVTNLLHLAELVHTAQQRDRLTPLTTLEWLADQRARVDAEEAGEAELRLERDDAAVRLLTMHKSKGLQFPVVFAPYLWDGRRVRHSHPLLVPDPAAPDRRVLATDVDDEAEPRATLLQRADREAAQEQMRLAYVALTRAVHRCVVYAGPSFNGSQNHYARSPLGALLHAPADAADRLDLELEHVNDPERLWSDLQRIAAAAPPRGGAPTLTATRCAAAGRARWTPPDEGERADPKARRYARGPFDAAWRVHSYSSLTRDKEVAEGLLHDPLAARPGASDEPADVDVPAVSAPGDVPLSTFAGGAQAGTFLHAILEEVDFTPTDDDPHREAALQAAIDHLGPRHGFTAERTAGLAAHLAEALRVPLGGPLGDFRLLDLPRADRLDELRFDLPVARVPGGAFADAFAYGAPGAGGLRADYVQGLRALGFDTIAGFLTGAIDLVFRRDGRWYVADYKSNRIDPRRTGTSPLAHYAQGYLQREMERHHYLLQAHLYALALHRYLRHRLGDAYSYADHFGGAVYLFLRGMTRPDLPVGPDGRAGVYHLRPDAAVLRALDELMEGL